MIQITGSALLDVNRDGLGEIATKDAEYTAWRFMMIIIAKILDIVIM